MPKNIPMQKRIITIIISMFFTIILFLCFVVSSITICSLPPVSAASSQEETYYTTIEEAGKAMRRQMIYRISPISIQYRTDSCNNELVTQIWEESLQHTGSFNEGDYLNYQIGSYSWTCSFYIQDEIYYYSLEYNIDYYTTNLQEVQMNLALRRLLSSLIPENSTDYEKVKAIYLYICENVDYDFNLQESNQLRFTAYAAFVKNTAVCQGYANLFYHMALLCGVDCRIICGTDSYGASHCWNIVKIDDLYYNIDITWDAPKVSLGGSTQYFLCGSSEFDQEHIRDTIYTTEEFQAKYPISETTYQEPPTFISINKIKLNKNHLILTEGNSAVLTAYVFPQNADIKQLFWKSSNETIVTAKNGKIIANLPGTSTITVSSANGITASCTITVLAEKDSEEKTGFFCELPIGFRQWASCFYDLVTYYLHRR